jgi:hypothetical protein
MKKLFAAALIAGMLAVPAFALGEGNPEQVCQGTKFDVEELPQSVDVDGDGDIDVTISLIEPELVYFDFSDEVATAQVCVKAGSANSGDGPEYVTLEGDGALSHSSGKDLSHVSVISITLKPTTPPPPPDDDNPPKDENPPKDAPVAKPAKKQPGFAG